MVIATLLVNDGVDIDASRFFGYFGIAIALILSNFGAAYGTCKSAVGISFGGIRFPDKVMKTIFPVIMAGILGIYGLIVSILLMQKLSMNEYSIQLGFKNMGSGLCCGIASLSSGLAIGIVGESGARALGLQDKVFVGLMVMLIFAEALGLYGLILALLLV